jgi:protein-S-isoprenylcysteine O-methyltransferase Ste14
MQRQLQTQAVQISSDLAQMRWMLIEQRQKSLPPTLLVVLVFWLAVLFTSFGLFAPRNATVITVLCISALSVSGALFLILEMNSPLDGMIKISSAPLHKALEHLGK